MEPFKLSPAIPQMPSGDIEKTAKFFVEFMGFEVILKEHTHDFLIVRRGHTEIHFWKSVTEEDARRIGMHSSCYIVVENIEPLFEEFKSRNVVFRHELRVQPWGMREMQIDDPYGNAIKFGEPTADALVKNIL